MSKAVEGEKSKDHLGCLKEAVFLSLFKTGEIECLGSSLILQSGFLWGFSVWYFQIPFISNVALITILLGGYSENE